MKIRWPDAKFRGESASDVQKSLAPQKLGKKRKKLFSYRKSNKNAIFFSRSEVGTPIFSRGKSARRVFRAEGRRGDFSCGRSEPVETYRQCFDARPARPNLGLAGRTIPVTNHTFKDIRNLAAMAKNIIGQQLVQQKQVGQELNGVS